MRWLRICILCSLTPLLWGAGIISATPTLPFSNTPVTFVLTANPSPMGGVTWDFGNGQGNSGGTVTTFTYAGPGQYTVRAVYQVYGPRQTLVTETAQLQFRVADRRGPSAPFALSSLRLRWPNGGVNLSVPRGHANLSADLDIQYEGTGLFQMQWLLDGVPLGLVTEQLAFAGTRTLSSSRLLPLPTQELGEHILSLRVLAPQNALPTPQIRYFVHREDTEAAPRAESVTPLSVQPGDEAEFVITGPGLAPGVRVSFGRDIALVAPLRFPKAGTVIAKVFIAPSARPGHREITVRTRHGSTRGPASFQVLPPRKP